MRRLRGAGTWTCVAVALVAVIWLALSLRLLVGAGREMRSGRRSLEAAREQIRPSSLETGRATPVLRMAQRRLTTGHRMVSSPLLVPLRVLPVAGRQLRSLSALSAAGATVAGVTADGLTRAHQLLATTADDPRARADLLRQLGNLGDRSRRRLAQAALGPRGGLVAPLARARNEAARDLRQLRGALEKGSAVAGTVSDLVARPSRYLVLGANNAEMRAGSGMFLSVGELSTGAGALHLDDMRSVLDVPVPPSVVPLGGDLADRWGWLRPNEEWRNLMVSPRFDVAAPLAREMWRAAGNGPVTGVMALDPLGLRAVLQVTGPVTVDGRRIGSDDVVDELIHGQYVEFSSEQTVERRDRLGRIARASFDALNASRWSVVTLASALSRAAGGRHLMMWSSDPREQAAWTLAGVDGSLQKDSLLVSVINRGGNKLDRFLQVSAELGLAVSGHDTECTVRLRLENHVPPGEPEEVAGPDRGSGVGPGVYLGIAAVNVPGAARDARIDGVEQLAVAGKDGPTRVVGVQLQVAPGGAQTIVMRFRLPTANGSLRVEPSARAPGITWTSGPRRWTDGTAHRIVWTAA